MVTTKANVKTRAWGPIDDYELLSIANGEDESKSCGALDNAKGYFKGEWCYCNT